jgi:hypothetical protein
VVDVIVDYTVVEFNQEYLQPEAPLYWRPSDVNTSPSKKWYQSDDDTGFDDRAGQALMAAGSLGLLPGPSDAAAFTFGGAVAAARGAGAGAALFYGALFAYGIPILAIGAGFALTRLD